MYCYGETVHLTFPNSPTTGADAEGTGTDWEQWSRQNEPLATRVPYMVSVGNHEFDYTSDTNHNDPSVTDGNYSVATQPFPGDDSGGECGVPVVNRFKTPSNGNGVFWSAVLLGLS
jgi:hypothetical protein